MGSVEYNVAIIKGNSDMVLLISEIIQEEGYRAHFITDAESVFSLPCIPDVILMETLASGGHITILEEIIARELKIPIIIMSALSKKQSLKLGAEYPIDVIDEPFDLDDFIKLLQKYHPSTRLKS